MKRRGSHVNSPIKCFEGSKKVEVCNMISNNSFRSRSFSPYSKLVENVECYMKRTNSWSDDLLQEIPKRWERHGDLVILPSTAFESPIWNVNNSAIWTAVANALGCNRLAKKSTVNRDGFRTPQVSLLKGSHGWVEHSDNGVKYSFDVTKCMFSSGNITEKIRIARLNCHEETVVDLYAGIGYFTLPFLIHAGAKHVYACEWNPDAVYALQRNLVFNKVNPKKCTILFGDNNDAELSNVADRVNLGLLPSSQSGWIVACRALKRSTGGILHIHENIDSPIHVSNQNNKEIRNEIFSQRNKQGHELKIVDKKDKWLKKSGDRPEWTKFSEMACERLKEILELINGDSWATLVLHIECVKFYAPHVAHIVVDIECRPYSSKI